MPDALDSVLAQTWRDLEVIVVDDGSEDGTAMLMESVDDARVRYVSQPRQGAGAARNHGARLARGRYVSFLDSDDLWTSDKLQLQLAHLTRHPALDAVFGAYVQFTDDDSHDKLARTQPAAPGYSCGTLLIRREAFDRVGEFSTQWRVGEFIEWYARAQDCSLRDDMLPDIVLRRRVHAANGSAQNLDVRRDYARMLHAVVARRRLRPTPGPC